ncbi:HAMP domain-containing sensor histidine kinase [Brevundimonas sp. 2R-24]|uniref:histidine kinase n=1 Tax=Peiella sedimenti TaxID=3061083 RepID=A0ABT8SLY5_9CAUL|nr:HAMP domain-containing sensor histidine kinase [Caulobacteraceae bacterium XZ-24]
MRVFGRSVWPPQGLSARMLLLTAGFTVAVELLILAPSAASFHERWLLDRVRAAEVASIGVDALPYDLVEDDVGRQLLEGAGVAAVAVGEEGVRRLLLRAPEMEEAPDFIDLRRTDYLARLTAPWETLFGAPDRMIRINARPRFRQGDFVEVVVPAVPLQRELRVYLLQILGVSALISLTAGALLYLALSALILRPVQRLTESIERFRADPEAPAPAVVEPRQDEIGRVEMELDRMREEVRQALRSRARLAALGAAVAKISHDLRNMLSAAQIASERLADSADPRVAKALPRLERALDRALTLSENVLDYGKTEEPAPQLHRLRLAGVVRAAAEDAGLDDQRVRLTWKGPARLQVQADPDHLHRILVNLMRNARQAIEQDRPGGEGRVAVSARREPGWVLIRLSDDGPGLPERIRQRLFQPFSGARPGGAGLGLAISRELAEAHGGRLELLDSGPTGAVFEIALPDPESPISA